MDRRDFVKAAATASAAAILPHTLLAEATKAANRERFPRPLVPKMDGDVKEFALEIVIAQQEPVPGFRFHTLAFNGQVPGPEIRVNRGDKVRVLFQNSTELNHTIHWHGLHVPWRMDGVPFVTQMPVMPGHEFVYEFVAEPYGTHFYHCHWGTLLHMQSGMYGSLVVADPENDPIQERFPYEREYTLAYSAHDVDFIRRELDDMLERMKERRYLMQSGRFDKRRWALFASREELASAVEDGYDPPYTRHRRSSAELPSPQWFTVNGRSYPTTPSLYITEGESIRVRLYNGGQLEHYLHLHGHDFWFVADDGLPVPDPRQMNTLRLCPGKTADIIIEGKNRGIWTFHDHDTSRVTNNGLYPGGTLMALVYEDLPPEEAELGMMAQKMGLHRLPVVALDE